MPTHPTLERAAQDARQFIGYTKLEQLLQADLGGSQCRALLQRLLVIEGELDRLARCDTNANTRARAATFRRAVQTGRTVIELLWVRRHGRPLPARPAAAASPGAVRVVA